MSHTQKRAKGKRSGTNYKATALTRKSVGSPSRMRHSGTILATTLGLGIAVAVVLGLALMVIIGHGRNAANASGGGPGIHVPVGYGSTSHPKGPCGNAGQAACTPADPGWFPITSESTGAVASAIASSKNFVAMKGRFGYVSLDTPALVHAYSAHTGNPYYDDDHWVVSVRNSSGVRSGIFDFVYDRAYQRMRFSSFGVITPSDPHSQQAFPYIASSTAVEKLQSQRGLGVRGGTQPELIFFPIDPSFPVLTSPVHKWRGGGNSPMEPMWHIVGSDGHDYFVGGDLNVHARLDLPIAKGQP